MSEKIYYSIKDNRMGAEYVKLSGPDQALQILNDRLMGAFKDTDFNVFCGEQCVTADFAWMTDITTGHQRWLYDPKFEPQQWLMPEQELPKDGHVNHPSHYNAGKIEVIEFIEDQFTSIEFHLGNAIKYISRAGKKDPAKTTEDLKKAKWYLARAVEVLEAREDERDPVRPNDMHPRQ